MSTRGKDLTDALAEPMNGNHADDDDDLDSETLRRLVRLISVRLARLDGEAEFMREDVKGILREHIELVKELAGFKSETRSSLMAIKDLLGEILSRLPEESLRPPPPPSSLPPVLPSEG